MSVSVPPGTEMFQFPGSRFRRLWIQRRMPPIARGRVAPFRDPRITACVRLPEAYRSLPRLSSPVEAKSSTMSPL